MLGYYRSAASYVNQWMSSDLIPNLESASSTIAWLRAEILPQLTGVVSGVSTVLMALFALFKDIIVAVIVSVYLLARKDVFAAQAKKIVYSLCPTRAADLLVAETRRAYRIFSGFITGSLIDSFIVGVLCLLCFSIFHFPYPMLLAVVIGVTNVIPFFGPFIGGIPCGLLVLLVSPRQCLYFVLFIFVLQQIDGNILHPKILGDSVGLASFWVLFSVLLFGGLFGFAGLVLGVPQTLRYFEQMQQRITGFVAGHSQISARRFNQLMMRTGELVMDVGTVLTGERAVKEGLIDQLGTLSDALQYLYSQIEQDGTQTPETAN